MVSIKSLLIRVISFSLLINFLGWSENEENEIKFNALYISNFAKYIRWPDSSSEEIIITVLGSDPVFNELKRIANVLSSGKKLRVQTSDDIGKISKTNIVFIPENKSEGLFHAVKFFAEKPVLIVTNKKGAILNGAGINLNNLYWKLRYEISVKNLKEHGLIADPVLYKLGKVFE